jgi:hypothetical protein
VRATHPGGHPRQSGATDILQPHRQATLERVRAEAVVIAAQDTTEIDLTRKQEKVGEPLSDTNHWDLSAHPVLMITPQRVPLGVVHVAMWSRDPKEFDKSAAERRAERRQKPFEEKESHRWLQGYEISMAMQSRRAFFKRPIMIWRASFRHWRISKPFSKRVI